MIRLLVRGAPPHRLLRVIDEVDAERVANAGKGLAPAASAYIEEDFIMNLLETVLDLHAADHGGREGSRVLSG